MNRRRMLQQVAVLAALGSPALKVLAGHESGHGDYRELDNRVQTDAEGRIEVIEFFHYGCPHCRDFHPLITAWKEEQPDDVVFRAVPAIWDNDQLRGLATLYYALERAGHLDDVEEQIFVAVQDERRPLFTEDGAHEWVAEQGIDADEFMDVYNSFSVQGLVRRADQLARSYRVQGVPTMAVDGRYITSASMTGGHEQTLEVVDRLVERRRDAL